MITLRRIVVHREKKPKDTLKGRPSERSLEFYVTFVAILGVVEVQDANTDNLRLEASEPFTFLNSMNPYCHL
uniref:Uncharacterized protein n=1 Tax=Ascaris lumbricoides TaxID=6252 RepID=A0A0M3ICV5_ASCLU